MSIFYQYDICFLKDFFISSYAHTCEFEGLQRQEEGIRSSRAGVTESYELLNMGARSQT